MSDGCGINSPKPKEIVRMRELLKKFGYGYMAELSDEIIMIVIRTYLSAREEIKAEEAAEKEKKEKIRQTERISEKDVGWFPGDCCD